MNGEKFIFCIIGKSSVGKDTIINNVTMANSRLSKIIPTTTRPPRQYEINGYDYFFISRESFMKKVDNHQFMEHRKYDVINKSGNSETWFYGNEFPKSPRSILTGSLEMYNSIVSNQNIKDYHVYPIYITIPDDERLYRMIRRESKNSRPNYKEVARRFISDNNSFSEKELLSSGINDSNTFINTNLLEVCEDINKYINNIINN